MKKLLWIAVATVGCAQAPSGDDVGNDSLGIARFNVSETADRTEVIGVDATGVEIAHVTLVHGRFTLSAPFTDDYATPDVDGRKLSVDFDGHSMRYEVAGYEPLLELPAPPASEAVLAHFVADPHVTAVLGRWNLGFEGSSLEGETAYFGTPPSSAPGGAYDGDSLQDCTGMTTCGTAYNGTINTCGGSAAAFHAKRATQRSGTNCGIYSSSYNQVLLSQCCPAGSGGQADPWFAQKACPTTSNNSTKCGTRSAGACKACPTYPVTATEVCSVTNSSYNQGTCGGLAVWQVEYHYADCYLQNWSCTADADCCSRYCDPYSNTCQPLTK